MNGGREREDKIAMMEVEKETAAFAGLIEVSLQSSISVSYTHLTLPTILLV